MLHKSNMSDLIFLDIPLEISEDPTLLRLYKEMKEIFVSLEKNCDNLITEMIDVRSPYPPLYSSDKRVKEKPVSLSDEDKKDSSLFRKKTQYEKDQKKFVKSLSDDGWIEEAKIHDAVQAELNEIFSSTWSTYGLPGDIVEENIIRGDISRTELADVLDAMVGFSEIKAIFSHDQLRALFSILSAVGGLWSFNVFKLLAGTQKAIPALGYTGAKGFVFGLMFSGFVNIVKLISILLAFVYGIDSLLKTVGYLIPLISNKIGLTWLLKGLRGFVTKVSNVLRRFFPGKKISPKEQEEQATIEECREIIKSIISDLNNIQSELRNPKAQTGLGFYELLGFSKSIKANQFNKVLFEAEIKKGNIQNWLRKSNNPKYNKLNSQKFQNIICRNEYKEPEYGTLIWTSPEPYDYGTDSNPTEESSRKYPVVHDFIDWRTLTKFLSEFEKSLANRNTKLKNILDKVPQATFHNMMRILSRKKIYKDPSTLKGDAKEAHDELAREISQVKNYIRQEQESLKWMSSKDPEKNNPAANEKFKSSRSDLRKLFMKTFGFYPTEPYQDKIINDIAIGMSDPEFVTFDDDSMTADEEYAGKLMIYRTINNAEGDLKDKLKRLLKLKNPELADEINKMNENLLRRKIRNLILECYS